MTQTSPPLLVLLSRLQVSGSLDSEVLRAISELPLTLQEVPAHRSILLLGERPQRCCVMVEGVAARYKILPDGKRQILSFHLPGEIPDLQTLQFPELDFSLATLMPSTVAFIAHADLRRLILDQPRASDAFWREALIDAAIMREWVVGLGRRDAYQRVSHFLCEMFTRMGAVGLTVDGRFLLPVTQVELGDALGLSTPHINRTFASLRLDGLIALLGAEVQITDWEGLVRAAGFDPTYLRIRPLRPPLPPLRI